MSLYVQRGTGTGRLQQKHPQKCYERQESAQKHTITGGAAMRMYLRLYLLLFISTGIVLYTCSLRQGIYPSHSPEQNCSSI